MGIQISKYHLQYSNFYKENQLNKKYNFLDLGCMSCKDSHIFCKYFIGNLDNNRRIK